MTQASSRSVASSIAIAAVLLGGCSTNPAPSSSNQPTSGASSPRSSSTTVKDGGTKTMTELFRGKFAGVEVFEAPGGGIRVKIRNSGRVSATFDTRDSDVGDPIYVVDGAEVSAPDGTIFIDPNIISKIEVDRVGALYGIRGSNGVIKITTKH
jgi:hypothetical protein